MAHVQTAIQKLRDYVDTQLVVANNPDPTQTHYGGIRSRFNGYAIETLIGAMFDEYPDPYGNIKKDEKGNPILDKKGKPQREGKWMPKGFKCLPTKTEYDKIMGIIDEFLVGVESKWLAALEKAGNPNDMELINVKINKIDNLEENLSNDNFREVVAEIRDCYLTKDHFQKLAKYAEKLRMKNYKKWGLIGLAGAGLAVGAGYYFLNKGKEDNVIPIEDCDELPEIVIDEELPEIILDEELPEIVINDD